ncbi:hypothetical protein [Pleionea sp. CnH1-48]|uniref:hypothetical protein n=1 Tax=Pleionea sp. CnH1-48 TaxID=2954494 RepID=UPI002096FC42|nr:hypothetical protein [Pleionea sp. CnH1-48]MCO7223168.1 hypothetical protein [Pleionea sp. CnH1-48]
MISVLVWQYLHRGEHLSTVQSTEHSVSHPIKTPATSSLASQTNTLDTEVAMDEASPAVHKPLAAKNPTRTLEEKDNTSPNEQDNASTEEAIIDQYESDFAQQEGDNIYAWQEIQSYFFDKDIPGVAFKYLECRQRSCRLELQIDDLDSRERFLENMGLPPFNQGGFYYTNDQSLIVFTNHLP